MRKQSTDQAQTMQSEQPMVQKQTMMEKPCGCKEMYHHHMHYHRMGGAIFGLLVIVGLVTLIVLQSKMLKALRKK